METLIGIEDSSVDFLHEIGGRLTTTEGFHAVLDRVVEFASALVKCDSCLIYVLEGEDLVLRASKNAHPDVVDRLKLRVGQGITGWVAKHREPVVVAQRAYEDARFRLFNELPEDRFEAFMSVPILSGGRLVMDAVRLSGAQLLPIDSEHNGVHQCLRAGDREQVSKLILTASGGPFRLMAKEAMAAVAAEPQTEGSRKASSLR